MKRLRTVIAFAALGLLAATTSARAVPPAAVGALASGNVEWVSSIPDLTPVGARFLGDTMYVTTSGGLRIYDTSAGIPTPLGALELPHYENEDVDTNGQILLIAADHAAALLNLLYVIDVHDPTLPRILSVIQTGAAHTASCLHNCQYAWMGGSSGGVFVIDLRDPVNPKQLGSFLLPRGGLAHDVQVDDAGVAWVSAASGLFGYTTADPLHPVLVASSVANKKPGSFHNDFIIHNSARPNASQWTPRSTDDGTVAPGELLLVTEENWLTADNGKCADDGRFQTGRYVNVNGVTSVQKLADFQIGRGTVPPDPANVDRKPTAVQSCSSHYFDPRGDGIVAVAWYEQGVRFLDVSDPRTIRQVGFYMPAVTEVFAVFFHGGYVYTLDTYRGMEVLRFTGAPGGPTALAPQVNPVSLATPSPTWGYACRRTPLA